MPLQLAFSRFYCQEEGVKAHILFVDDEAPIRELLSVYFRKRGLEVTTAMNSKEAREASDKAQFNLVILDLGLAGENGLELLKYFKEKWPNVPVIIFTGMPRQDWLDQAMAGGADGVMRKNESLGSLYDEVVKHLPAA